MELLRGLVRGARRLGLLQRVQVLLDVADLQVDYVQQVLAVRPPLLEVAIVDVHDLHDALFHHLEGLHGVAAEGVRVLAAIVGDQVEVVITLKGL